jgi:hypothetical protein
MAVPYYFALESLLRPTAKNNDWNAKKSHYTASDPSNQDWKAQAIVFINFSLVMSRDQDGRTADQHGLAIHAMAQSLPFTPGFGVTVVLPLFFRQIADLGRILHAAA